MRNVEPSHVWVGIYKFRWNETSGQLYAQSRKDVFERYSSVRSNLASLNPCTAVMQQKASTWVDFISPYGQHSLYIYNKVYIPAMGVLSLRIYIGLRRGVNISSLAWAGLTLLILTWGQCESLILGISTEGTYSHVFFVSIFLW